MFQEQRIKEVWPQRGIQASIFKGLETLLIVKKKNLSSFFPFLPFRVCLVESILSTLCKSSAPTVLQAQHPELRGQRDAETERSRRVRKGFQEEAAYQWVLKYK